MSLPTNFFIGRGGKSFLPLSEAIIQSNQNGPTLPQASHYIARSSAFPSYDFSFFENPAAIVVEDNYVKYTVEQTGSYTIRAAGGSFDAATYGGVSNGASEGSGAFQQGDWYLTAGTQLWMIIGQSGRFNHGSGGTFVGTAPVTNQSNLMVVGGGGGGRGPYASSWRGYNASTSTVNSGNGGSGGSHGAGGGGWFSNGGAASNEATSADYFGISYANGGGRSTGTSIGGFGGGGGGSSTGGGGGGYGGGNGGVTNTGSQNGYGPGYGGGSYITGASNVSSGVRHTSDTLLGGSGLNKNGYVYIRYNG
jgi:hypothetical protein